MLTLPENYDNDPGHQMQDENDAERQTAKDEILIAGMMAQVEAVEWRNYRVTVDFRGRRICRGVQIKAIKFTKEGGDGKKQGGG